MDGVKSLDEMLDNALDQYYKYPENEELKNEVDSLLRKKQAQSKLKSMLGEDETLEEQQSIRVPRTAPNSVVWTVRKKKSPSEPSVVSSDTYTSSDIDKEHFKNFLKSQFNKSTYSDDLNNQLDGSSLSRAPASIDTPDESEQPTEQDKKAASWYKDPQEWYNLKRMIRKNK